jgi:4-amino-4-deoxy-L-arabinose transferase-like glycosyltransferase
MDKKTAFALLLGLVTATGIWLLTISTPGGLGLIDDAISYIAAARALLSGLGFTRTWLGSGLEPITHWPPGYPATLAAISYFLKIDPYRSARALNALLLGGNAALLALLGYKMTRSTLWAGILSLLFLTNNAILRLHAQALSEPLYLFVSMLAFWAFYAAIERNDNKNAFLLVLTGFLTALSYITRYAALSLFATFVAAILILFPTWRKRFISLAYFLIGAVPPIYAWMARNEAVGGSATNRAMRWHPVTLENVQRGLHEFFAFLIPLRSLWGSWYENYTFLGWLLGLLTVGLLFWLLPQGLRSFFKPGKHKTPEPLPFITALYLFGYMGSLLVSLTLFDAATPLNDRILSPVYVAALIMLVYFFFRRSGQGKIAIRAIAFIVPIFFLAIFIPSQTEMVRELQQTPTGFASWRWRESVVMEAIRALPEDVAVYTNQPPAVFFWTGRAPYMIWDVEQLHAEIEAGDAVLAYFFFEGANPEKVEKLTAGLTPIVKSGLGNLYTK